MAGNNREVLGSWLSGPRSMADPSTFGYAGERLGLPATGQGSVAGWGRRIVALVVDWFVALAITGLLFPNLERTSYTHSFVVLVVFAAHVGLLEMLVGASFGQRLLGLTLARVGERPASRWRVGVRAVLVACVLPALLYDRDRRGLPDYFARTVLVRARRPR